MDNKLAINETRFQQKTLVSLFLGLAMASAWSMQLRSLASESSLLQSLNTYAQKCLFLKSVPSCEKALTISDDLQRKAGALKKYSCQTMTLGLGSNLLMTSFEGGRDQKALQSLAEVNKLCRGL